MTVLPFRARQWSINDDVHTIYSGTTSQDLISNNYNSIMGSLGYSEFSNLDSNTNSVSTTINNIIGNTTTPTPNQ